MREPSWSRRVKIAGRYTCRFCGEGSFDHEIIDAHHIKRRSDRPDLADVVENGECLCMFDHAKEHYKRGDFWGCVLILLRLLKLMRKRANWPVINYKDYQTISAVYRKGLNYEVAAKYLGCSRYTVRRRINKIKKYYPDVLTKKGELYLHPLPENYEDFTKQVF